MKGREIMPSPLLEVEGLRVAFPTDKGTLRAVDDVSFSIPRGKTLAVVGESGCGKSMTALSIMRLVPPPGRIESGSIRYCPDGAADPIDLTQLPPKGGRMRSIRGNEIAMIFQEPMTSLNPVYTIGNQIGEAVRLHQRRNRKEARQAAVSMLKRVGIPDAEERVDAYPHQLSGGMRQRAMIAVALSCRPSLLIADEPTTALDVTIQAQVLDLLRGLQEEMGMALLLITHDLGVVASMADEVAVLYAGRAAEICGAEAAFSSPLHPYTQGLLASVPTLSGSGEGRMRSLPGRAPHPLELPQGCAFSPRCPERAEVCREEPELKEVGEGRAVRCWMR